MRKEKLIKRIGTLKRLCKNKPCEFYIRLNGGMRSSKTISYDPEANTFWVLHEIDDSEGVYSEQDFRKTFIFEAMEKQALYKY